MRLSFEPFVADEAELLVRWLSSETWPFHVNARPEPDEVRSRLRAGDYTEDTETFWVLMGGTERVGLIRLWDLSDPGPTTDFRVREACRGRGTGGRMVRWAAVHVFRPTADGSLADSLGYAILGNNRRGGEPAPVPPGV